MTIYVDDIRIPARVGRVSARWSHLSAGPFDDLAELHEFAARIGLRRSWFQAKGWPRDHYDVTDSKRAEAIAAGAVPITWRDLGAQIVRARRAWKTASGGLVCTRTADGKPPGQDDLWQVAKALYELAAAREAASLNAPEGAS
jgi:Protein of unknown function (DUF4031)